MLFLITDFSKADGTFSLLESSFEFDVSGEYYSSRLAKGLFRGDVGMRVRSLSLAKKDPALSFQLPHEASRPHHCCNETLSRFLKKDFLECYDF